MQGEEAEVKAGIEKCERGRADPCCEGEGGEKEAAALHGPSQDNLRDAILKQIWLGVVTRLPEQRDSGVRDADVRNLAVGVQRNFLVAKMWFHFPNTTPAVCSWTERTELITDSGSLFSCWGVRATSVCSLLPCNSTSPPFDLLAELV